MGCGGSKEEDLPPPPEPENKPLEEKKQAISDETAAINAKIAEKAAAKAATGETHVRQKTFKRKFGQQRKEGESRGHNIKRTGAEVDPEQMARAKSRLRRVVEKPANVVQKSLTRMRTTRSARSLTRKPGMVRSMTRRALHNTSHGHLPGSHLAEKIAKGWIGMLRTGKHQSTGTSAEEPREETRKQTTFAESEEPAEPEEPPPAAQAPDTAVQSV